jgi:uncharacterized protein (TIGR03083 family)
MSPGPPRRLIRVDDTRIRTETAAERREQADLLAALTEEQWDAPTLCEGWRVREVIAHTTMPYRTSLARVVLEVVRARGSFDRMADRRARADAARSTSAELVAALRDNAEHPWAPPGGGRLGALSHDLIHGLDVTVALGLDRTPPPERVGMVLSGFDTRRARFFGIDVTGLRFVATDVDWSYGEGAEVRGPAAALLLAVCGRRVPDGHLTGTPASRFTG